MHNPTLPEVTAKLPVQVSREEAARAARECGIPLKDGRLPAADEKWLVLMLAAERRYA